ncbi:hypothetical protein MW887_003062 [Aspergillus wentii]|nr:hypothetical protein MW887_003062 [Aspergillus wentii]
MDTPRFYTTAAIAGVATHLFYFKHGEHHLHAIRYMVIFFASVVTSIALMTAHGESVYHASSQVSQITAIYLGGLYASLTIYRLLFNPLNRLPGPIGARLSSLWFSSQLIKSLTSYRTLNALHKKHGQIVRIGPSELSIITPNAVKTVHDPKSGCTRAEYYDITFPAVSLQTTRDKTFHHQKRREWSQAFGSKALHSYEPRIRAHRERFIAQVAKTDSPIDITKWFYWYAFDVMGDLSFGYSFGMVEDGKDHWAIRLLNDSLRPLGYMLPVWLFQVEPTIPDISTAVLAPLKGKTLTEQDRNIMRGDAQLMVVAGSDTTATSLSSIFYELCSHPNHIAKLRQELAPHLTESGTYHHENLFHLNHLNAVINEAMRLHPPIPSGMTRLTPPEGITIDGVYIPGNTTLFLPQYPTGRNEAIYDQADSFIPERWYSKPEMIKEKSAFAPFLIGPYNCIGKPLALLNIRTLVAQLVTDFDFEFAPSENGEEFMGEAMDHITLELGKCIISFRARE